MRWGVLVLNCSTQLLSATRAEREEGGSGATGGGGSRNKGEVCTWGGTKADGADCVDVRTSER